MRASDLFERSLIDLTGGAVDDRALETLMLAYARGDRQAWEQLFGRLAPRLLAFLRRWLQDPALAESYVQASFVALHRARHKYEPGTPVRCWMFAIATRVRVDHASIGPAANRAAPASLPGENPRDCQVRLALDSLGGSERGIIHLHRFERMNFQDIGAVFGWSEAAVRQRVASAYRQLRERLWSLSDDGEGP